MHSKFIFCIHLVYSLVYFIIFVFLNSISFFLLIRLIFVFVSLSLSTTLSPLWHLATIPRYFSTTLFFATLCSLQLFATLGLAHLSWLSFCQVPWQRSGRMAGLFSFYKGKVLVIVNVASQNPCHVVFVTSSFSLIVPSNQFKDLIFSSFLLFSVTTCTTNVINFDNIYNICLGLRQRLDQLQV